MACDDGRVDLALAAEPAGGVLALSLDAFGEGLPGLPAGVIDFATEVRLQGDEFVPWAPVPADAPALDGCHRGRGAGHGPFAGRARLRLGPTDRVLSTLDWGALAGLDRWAARGAGRRGVAGAVPKPGPGRPGPRARPSGPRFGSTDAGPSHLFEPGGGVLPVAQNAPDRRDHVLDLGPACLCAW